MSTSSSCRCSARRKTSRSITPQTKTLTLVSFVYFSVSAATAHRFSEYQIRRATNTRLQEFLVEGNDANILAVRGW